MQDALRISCSPGAASLVLLACVGLSCVGVSCATPAKNLKLLSLEPEPRPSKSIGPISASACVNRILGIQIGRDPTFSDALGNLSRKHEVSYIQNLAYDGSLDFDFVVYGRKCLGVKGVGYK